MDRLPQELVDAIVDVLRNDRRSLRALLCVSRSLHSQAKVHFFRSLYLATERSVSGFHDSCIRSPDIPRLVQNFFLTLWDNAGFRASLEQLLRRFPLPNVHTLNLAMYTENYDIKKIPAALLSCPLTSLTLRAVIFYPEDLPKFLRCYPALRHLDFSSARIPTTSMEQIDQGTVLSIEDLSISCNFVPLCLDKQLFSLHALRRIKLASFQLTRLHECQRLLESPNGILQRLHIYQPHDYGEFHFAAFNLTALDHHYSSESSSRPMHKLEMLHVPFLIFEVSRNDRIALISMKWFIDCLRSGKGPVRTSQINIACSPSGKFDRSFLQRAVDESVWSSLDSLMTTTPRFADTTLCIWVGYGVQWYPRKPDSDLLEITRGFILNALPRLRLVNRLEVHCKVLQRSFDEVMYLIGEK
ncbi:uncharacterized protein BT62DRAFT_1009473 [Guyanagaster necrorhizus]|uniref:F-box domain-containing protein n=1 Tax=Guyanagaster necrorhizus TaxID=856835 RepID=A0A9P8APR5_9AGAR|nr:uncharacterized protein BT62DRAFT_1009473 [Guyanagaster necrorhizus MCA 3950]KAG7443269.1 hypothetical protein BT62DRAFT_1009473 [Guyanagaster necrorhizus MCA 3950]